MRTLAEIANDIRTAVGAAGFTVRFSTAESSPQLLGELRAMAESRLPAVVIVISDGEFTDSVRKQALTVTLVLIDRFTAGSDERAVSAWKAVQRMMAVFPADVTERNGVFYLPRRFYAASGDPKYTCFAFEIEAHQAI